MHISRVWSFDRGVEAAETICISKSHKNDIKDLQLKKCKYLLRNKSCGKFLLYNQNSIFLDLEYIKWV